MPTPLIARLAFFSLAMPGIFCPAKWLAAQPSPLSGPATVSMTKVRHAQYSHPHVLLLGPPGCGKGTCAQLLEHHFGYWPVSLGDLLRGELGRGGPHQQQILEAFERGFWLDNRIPFTVFREALEAGLQTHRPILIDAFARDQASSDFLNQLASESGLAEDLFVILMNG